MNLKDEDLVSAIAPVVDTGDEEAAAEPDGSLDASADGSAHGSPDGAA
jgi:hypothetical protein